METLLLLIDAIAMALVLYYSRTNDKRTGEDRQKGFFSYSETAPLKPDPRAVARARSRL